jgi:hypothetical protein
MHASAFLVSPDGQSVAGIGPDQVGYIYPTTGGDGRPIRGMEMGEQPIAWSQDGLSLFIYLPGELPAKISRLELASGRKTALEQLMPVILPEWKRLGQSCSPRMERRASTDIRGRFPISIWWKGCSRPRSRWSIFWAASLTLNVLEVGRSSYGKRTSKL